MKLYVSPLVLLLLLVNSSVSAVSIPTFKIAEIFKNPISKPSLESTKKVLDFLKEVVELVLEKRRDSLPSPPSPTLLKNETLASSSSQQQKVKGLGLLKQYFYDFGHYPNTGSENFTDYVDDNVKLAVRNYQKYFNLTKNQPNITLDHILMQRCGVPDRNYDYGFKDNNILSWPKGTFFPAGEKKKVLTYGFEPDSQIPRNMLNVFRRAFQRWSSSTQNVNLTEATTSPDIMVGFYQTNRTFEDLVVGDAVIQLKTNNNVVGKVRLDYDQPWVLHGEEGGIDLETVAMHQIGHLLGLDHSNDEDAVMYPSVLPSRPRKVELALDDVQKMQQLYDTPTTSTSGDARRVWKLVIALLHFFAFVILVH